MQYNYAPIYDDPVFYMPQALPAFTSQKRYSGTRKK